MQKPLEVKINRRVQFDKKTRDTFSEILKRHQVEHLKDLVDEIEFVCEDAAGRQPDRHNRKKELERFFRNLKDKDIDRNFKLDKSKWHKMPQKGAVKKLIDELVTFTSDHFPNDRELYRAATNVQRDLIPLASILESRLRFKKFKTGRPVESRSLALARSLKSSFERFGLPVSSYPEGLFFEVLSQCLEVLKLPSQDPSRIVARLK